MNCSEVSTPLGTFSYTDVFGFGLKKGAKGQTKAPLLYTVTVEFTSSFS